VIRHPLAAVAFAVFAIAVFGQKADDVKKQKAAAEEAMKSAKVDKPTLHETDALLVYSSLPAEKLKPLAESAQATFAFTAKALKLDGKDAKLWPGKLTVYALPDRTKEFVPFLKLVEQRSGKLDADEIISLKLRGNEPYAAVGRTQAAKGANLEESVSQAVAMALLNQKAGAPSVPFSLPTWLETNFGMIATYRAEKSGKSLAAFKVRTAQYFTKSKIGLFKADDAWSDKTYAGLDTIKLSLVDYLAFGPDAEKFEKFVTGFRPNDQRSDPDVGSALEAAGLKADELDVAWKKWVMKK